MPERIYKLQPNRTLSLRGFDDLGAAAALHSATPTSFKVSGIFRDPADFCVLILHDADNFYEHPSIRYLPDTNFAGLTLSFDVHYSGLRTLDSPRYATIDWPYLDVTPAGGGDNLRIPLFPNATLAGGTYAAASGAFTVVDNGLKEYDRLTLWYLNYAFDYIVPKVEASYAYSPGGGGTVHSLTIAGTTYSYTELAGDQDYTIAQRLADAASASPYVTALRTYGQVDLRARKTDGLGFDVSASSGATYTLYGVGASTVAAALAGQIAGVDWVKTGVAMPLTAEASDATITVSTTRPGVDGNAITMYAVAKNTRLVTTSPSASFSGGVSDATWHVTLDFSTLKIPDIRQMWLTFAPPVSSGQAFTDTEWEATFTNWHLSGPEDTKKLQVAGPGSIRLDDNDSACVYQGTWNLEAGFYSRGYARRSTALNDTVTISYDCAYTHDLYLGTSLYTDRGKVAVRLDGDAETTLDCYLKNEPAVVTRRKLRTASVPPGHHTVTLRASAGFFYFDFFEAAVVSDVPDARPGRANISPALDYSTDHTYKLSPARLMWIFDKLGFTGPMNQYIGVFWWNQRVREDAIIPTATVTFSGTFVEGDQIIIDIGGQKVGKTVFANESNSTFASHFAYFINATLVGVWAAASGDSVTITAHSPTAAYSFPVTPSVEPKAGSTGTAKLNGWLQGGTAGTWVVDPSQSPALNRGARDWHADLYSECAARNRDIVTAASMELVNPPAGFPARYADVDRTPVTTSVGFGTLKSSHCAFNSLMRSYQQEVFDDIATLQSAAGLRPHVQFGEFCWWYFPLADGTSMAFYDDETMDAAHDALNRPLEIFTSADDDPLVNAGADATFLRNRLRDHLAAMIANLRTNHPTARFEVLFPYDVNYPSVVGIHALGGRLLNFINFPTEWSTPATSGFDTLKMEALDFGSGTRSLILARAAIEFPIRQGWPRAQVRYLVPIFNGGCPWKQEYKLAADLGVPVINLWAFDHVCIFGLALTEPGKMARSARFL